MNAQDEFLELIQQARAHTQYYQLLGLTHIGSRVQEMPDTVPLRVAERVAADKIVEDKIVEVKTEIEKEDQMPKSDKKAPALFGEALEPTALAIDALVDESLEDIRRDLGECRRCKLWTTRTNLVFGEGSAQASLMFVGEGPGADEDATGRPFIGRAGQLLTKMIEAIEFKREDVYIANVVKSRPPNNRAPEADEVAACKPFLWRQIAVIRPKLIVTLGNPATQLLLETKIGITQLRGKLQEYTRVPGIKVMPTFHPAYLLRSPDKKREAWDDLKKVRAFLRGELE